jgi:hypothetical protein
MGVAWRRGDLHEVVRVLPEVVCCLAYDEAANASCLDVGPEKCDDLPAAPADQMPTTGACASQSTKEVAA